MPLRDAPNAEGCNVFGAGHIAAVNELRKVAVELRIFGESALMVEEVRVRRFSPEARANESAFNVDDVVAGHGMLSSGLLIIGGARSIAMTSRAKEDLADASRRLQALTETTTGTTAGTIGENIPTHAAAVFWPEIPKRKRFRSW
jgi:hypothetical protein